MQEIQLTITSLIRNNFNQPATRILHHVLEFFVLRNLKIWSFKIMALCSEMYCFRTAFHTYQKNNTGLKSFRQKGKGNQSKQEI